MAILAAPCAVVIADADLISIGLQRFRQILGAAGS